MKDYTYSIARIRAKELQLLDEAEIDRLLSCDGYDAAKAVLREKGYGTDEEFYRFVKSVADDELLRVLSLPTDYHNLKVAVKSAYENADNTGILKDGGSLDKELIYDSVRTRNFDDMPPYLSQIAEDTLALLLRTGDGQLCDIAIDKAMYEECIRVAEQSGDKCLIDYVNLLVDTANLKTALKSTLMGKSGQFAHQALADGGTLDVKSLAEAVDDGVDALYKYVRNTDYAEGVNYMEKSAAVFEKWCDDTIMSNMQKAKFEISSSAPVIAYIYAKRTEEDVIRLILSGKKNNLDNDVIREKVRMTYA